MSFESAGLRLAIADINPLRLVTAAVKRTPKYTQIATSIREGGLMRCGGLVARSDRARPMMGTR